MNLKKNCKKINFFRNEYESLTLDEAQVRYELDQLSKQLSDQLQERDEAHADRIRVIEQVQFLKKIREITNWIFFSSF